MKAADICGLRYWHLTALEPTDAVSKTEGRIWKFKCDCGNLTYLPVQRVKQGRTKSCGCLSRKCARDITGMQFGRLTAISPTEERDRGEVVWLFRCECGTLIHRPQNLVSSGKCSSCGCLGEETRQNLYETKFKRNHVMGTSLVAISASEDHLSALNKTGVKGVFFDANRGCYVAHLKFQSKNYSIRCSSFSEAKAVRKRMKALHYAFLEWWHQLTEPERLKWMQKYETEQQAQREAFREKLRQWYEDYPIFFPEASDGKLVF